MTVTDDQLYTYDVFDVAKNRLTKCVKFQTKIKDLMFDFKICH